MDAEEGFDALDNGSAPEVMQRFARGAQSLKPGDDSPRSAPHSVVELVRASMIPPESISWIWSGWLAEGKLHILGGAPGTGKTTIALSLAATVSTAGRFPDGTRCEMPGDVVIWSGEDAPSDTLVPRLIAAGANRDRIHFIQGKRSPGETRSTPFDPASDLGLLVQTLQVLPDLRLIIVDPIVSAVSGDSHKNTEVRRALQPLVDLAANQKAAILGITHFSKGTGGRNPTERITGSVAFGAVARVVLVTAQNSSPAGNEYRQTFMRAKSNIGPDIGGFEYNLVQVELPDHPGVSASNVAWGGWVEGSAREILDEVENPTPKAPTDTMRCKDWLKESLANGPQAGKEIEQQARAQGFSVKVLRLARKQLCVSSKSTGFGPDKAAQLFLPAEAASGSRAEMEPEGKIGEA